MRIVNAHIFATHEIRANDDGDDEDDDDARENTHTHADDLAAVCVYIS